MESLALNSYLVKRNLYFNFSKPFAKVESHNRDAYGKDWKLANPQRSVF